MESRFQVRKDQYETLVKYAETTGTTVDEVFVALIEEYIRDVERGLVDIVR